MSSSVIASNTLKKGNTYIGIVENIKSYGAFIRIENEATGILYKEDITWCKAYDLREKLNIGDELAVTVKKYDRDTGKLSFISTESPEHSFNERVQAVKCDDVLGGVVRSRHKNSVFVEISGGLVGLADYNPSLSYGDFVTVKVKKVSEDGRKIKLKILD